MPNGPACASPSLKVKLFHAQGELVQLKCGRDELLLTRPDDKCNYAEEPNATHADIHTCDTSVRTSIVDAAAGSLPPQGALALTPASKIDDAAKYPCTPTGGMPIAERCSLTGSSDDSDDCEAGKHADFQMPANLRDTLVFNEEIEQLQEEWQFEILNHFPRDKAITFIDHLQSIDLRCSRAKEREIWLTQEVCRLQEQLTTRKAFQTESSQTARGNACCRFLKLFMCLLAIAIGFHHVEEINRSLLEPIHAADRFSLQQRASSMSLVPRQGNGTLTLSHMTQRSRGNCSPCPAVVDDYEKDMANHMMKEHEAMKQQLELLWNDIGTAIDAGRNVVCWNVN